MEEPASFCVRRHCRKVMKRGETVGFVLQKVTLAVMWWKQERQQGDGCKGQPREGASIVRGDLSQVDSARVLVYHSLPHWKLHLQCIVLDTISQAVTREVGLTESGDSVKPRPSERIGLVTVETDWIQGCAVCTSGPSCSPAFLFLPWMITQRSCHRVGLTLLDSLVSRITSKTDFNWLMSHQSQVFCDRR